MLSPRPRPTGRDRRYDYTVPVRARPVWFTHERYVIGEERQYMTNQILQVLLLILQLLTWALVGRAILSWIDPGMRWPVTRVLNDATDPLIAPIRSIIPPMGMIDLSFIVAIILLQVLRQLLISALS